MEIDWNDIHKKFGGKFRDEEIAVNQPNKGGGQYVDARSVAERLDDVVGPGAWSTRFRLIDPSSGAVECTLIVHGVEKTDIGYPNSPMGTLNKSGNLLETEPLKAAYSDALKRAAVHWGIARYLYPYANKRKREAESSEEADAPREDPKESKKAAAVAPHIPDIASLRDEVEAAVVTVAQAEQREAKDMLQMAIKATEIRVRRDWLDYPINDLQALKDWLAKRLDSVPV